MSLLEKLFNPAIGGLLLGLATHALADVVPQRVQHWSGRVALGAVLIAATVYVLLLMFHRIVPRRFANLVYLFDDDMNVAMVTHPFHKRLQPPGSRLGYHEAPHDAVYRVVRDELGLSDPTRISFVPDGARTIGKVKIVPAPVQVQVEHRTQRLGVSEHYDFVYVCRIRGSRPQMSSPLDPRWMSAREIHDITGVDSVPFEDVVPTLDRLVSQLSAHPSPQQEAHHCNCDASSLRQL